MLRTVQWPSAFKALQAAQFFTFHSAHSTVGATGATLLGKQCPNIVCFCVTCAESCGFAALMMVNVAGGSVFVWLE